MKKSAVCALVLLAATSGALMATPGSPTVPGSFGVTDTSTPTPVFSWTAPISGAEYFDIKIQRYASGAWTTFQTAVLDGDETDIQFQGPGTDFRSGTYRAALRARTPFWTGAWTAWTPFTIAGASGAPTPIADFFTSTMFITDPVTMSVVITSITDTFAEFSGTWLAPAGTSSSKVRIQKYNPSLNAWTDKLVQTVGDGYASTSPMTHTYEITDRLSELQPGLYRWDVAALNRAAQWEPNGGWATSAPFTFTIAQDPVTLTSPIVGFLQSQVPESIRVSYDSARAAIWHQYKLYLNGTLLATGWQDIDESGPAGEVINADAQSGAYRFDLRGWNTLGFGPWGTITTTVDANATPLTIPTVFSADFTTGFIFAWETAQNSKKTQVRITRNGNVIRNEMVPPASVGAPYAIQQQLYPGPGTYLAQVRGFNPYAAVPYGPWSSPLTFTCTPMSITTPASLSAPITGIGVNDAVFAWHGVPDAVKYELRVRTANSALLDWTTIVGTDNLGGDYSTQLTWDLPAGLLKWRVTPIDVFGNRGASTPWTFFTASAP